MGIHLGLFLLSAATLAFEINLTRVFSVAQFYHFAFMIVSLALLGFGASGTFLALFPRLKERNPAQLLTWLGWGFALTTVGSYALTLYVPFDSFRIARERWQGAVLILHYAGLALPFFCSGAAVGLLFTVYPDRAPSTYAANLIGSAAGCLLAIVAPSLVGGEGLVFLSAALGLLAALTFHQRVARNGGRKPRTRHVVLCGAQVSVVIVLISAALWTPPGLEIRLSPYKSLSYALLYPDVEPVFQRWNGFSRVDVVRSSSIRSLPGRGFLCPSQPPRQSGLTVDGDGLSPISQVEPDFASLPFIDCVMSVLPYRLRPDARTLILEPRGGFDVLVALAEGVRQATVVEANPLVVEAVRAQGEWAGNLYDDPRVTVVVEEGRAYARRATEPYDVVVLSLVAPQRQVTSGAYSLAEDYRYTVEAFSDYMSRLDENGLLVVMRWLQVPPSESVRAFALAVEAVERAGDDPKESIVALRSYLQMTILIRCGGFTEEEVEAIRAFAAPRAFDVVYLPGIRPEEVNRHNVLPQSDYYDAFVGLLGAEDREAWYRAYPFDVEPSTDNHPFFGHFFKWRQASQVLAMAGHTWQPFGGAGYFVLLVLLVVALIAAGVLILLPLAAYRRDGMSPGGPLGATLGYFALLGLGFLCVEIPLLQQFILFLGHPAYAMATVLFTLLLFSGVGSLLSRRLSQRLTLVLLPVLVGGYAMGLPILLRAALGATLGLRVLLSVVALAPAGLLMGMPFPQGLAQVERMSTGPALIAWAWGVNGAVSVVASILAALLALSFGFFVVLMTGAACYAGALVMVWAIHIHPRPDETLPPDL